MQMAPLPTTDTFSIILGSATGPQPVAVWEQLIAFHRDGYKQFCEVFCAMQ